MHVFIRLIKIRPISLSNLESDALMKGLGHYYGQNSEYSLRGQTEECQRRSLTIYIVKEGKEMKRK
jgi:hypothetical protein